MNRELADCPLCGETRGREMYRFEPALWIPGRVIRCAGCNTVYKRLSDTARPIAEYYTDPHYHELQYWTFEKEALRALTGIRDSVVKTLGKPSSASLLEVGCGPGQFLALAQEVGFEVSGVELNAEHVRQARERTHGANVVCGNFMTVPFDRQFDVITMLDLIEHLPDPLAALRRSYDLLKPGGHLVVYTPNHSGITTRVADWVYRLSGGRLAGPVIELFDCLHVVFFDVSSLELALQKTRFKVAKTILSPYDASRNNQATGVAAWGVRALEAMGSVAFGQFRILMFGRKMAAAVSQQTSTPRNGRKERISSPSASVAGR